MPTPPKVVGREFARCYYTLMNKSPENLHNFFVESANFIHDDIDPSEQRTLNADSKMAIRDIMHERMAKYKHTSTKIDNVDTLETLNNGLLVRITGEISFNEQPMRPFSQSIILIPHTPFQYFVQNDIFRFCDLDMNAAKSRSDSVCSQTLPVEENWGTQCEQYVAPPDEEIASQPTEPREHENEVKLDTSDSGLSSDAEKAIMDIQSINLKNILLESRTITKESVMKRGPTPPIPVEEEIKPAADEIPQNHSALFRDSCILTIGNVINPNIEFDEANPAGNVTLENDKTQNSIDTSASKSDENSSGKTKYRKRKDKRKPKHEMSKEKPADEPNEQHEPTELPNENNSEHLPTENAPDKAADKLTSDTVKESEEDTSNATREVKTYADLAKAGKDEWIDELAARRNSNPSIERRKTRISMSGRRNSKAERTPPTNGKLQFSFLEFFNEFSIYFT